MPSKRDLMNRIEADGINSLTLREMKLFKRRLTKEKIMQNNLESLAK